jgi:glucan phosphoethanolaminetransferase (alkaline phosphatase superfamily)
MTEWSIIQSNDHHFENFRWFKDDYECFSIFILFEKWEWRWKINHQRFHFFDQFVFQILIVVLIWIEFFVFSNVLINSLIHLIDKTIFELSFCIFAFIFCMLCWSTFFFLTDKAYFFRTILISSNLMFSMLFSNSRLKISMIATIDEVKNELDEKRELDEMNFLISCYWRFQIINQLCQNVVRLKACTLTCRNFLTCID